MSKLELLLLLAIFGTVGPNMLFWSSMGIFRFLFGEFQSQETRETQQVNLKEVAVLIAAHNEEIALPSCLAAISKLLPPAQIHIGDDASGDTTRKIAKDFGCKIFSAKKNMGKARILDATMRKFDLCRRYKVVLILDADSEIDENYLVRGLPIFDDPTVAVVAGHVISRASANMFSISQAIHLHRVRLYFLLQALFRFGQTWKYANVCFVAPGFASMYRTNVLEKLEFTAPDLVIEDINMTFEVHRRQLGRIAYSPHVKCTTEDPPNMRDYSKQIRRWNLGLWQTVRKQRFWPSTFWLSFSVQQFETILTSICVVLLPFLIFYSVVGGKILTLWSPIDGGYVSIPIIAFPIMYVMADLILTCITSVILGRPLMVLYSPIFLLFRYLDAVTTLVTIPAAFFTKSDGRWSSPQRRNRYTKA